MTEKHQFGITQETLNLLDSGNTDTLIMLLAGFAKYWVEISGYPAQTWKSISLTHAAANNNTGPHNTTSEQRAFLAAGCDLFNLLNSTPQGRKALDLLFEQPITQRPEGK